MDILHPVRDTSIKAEGLLVVIIVQLWAQGVQVDKELGCVGTSWLASVDEQIVDSGKLLFSARLKMAKLTISHDLDRALCRFWLRGHCAKGPNCE